MENILQKINQCIEDDFFELMCIEIKEPIKKHDVITKISHLGGLSDLLKKSAANNKEIIHDFDKVVDYMDTHKFNIREKFMTTMYLIERNISKGFADGPSIMLSLDNMDSIGLSDSEIDMIESAIENGRMLSILEKIRYSLNNIEYEIELSEEEKKIESIISTNLAELIVVGSEELREYHLVIKEHYLDKIDSYTEEDIYLVIDTLSKLGISENNCKGMKNIMVKDLQKRKNISAKVMKVQGRNYENTSKNSISNKEYKRLLIELRKYIDIDSKSVTHLLSMDEIIKCTSIMIQLGIDENEIKAYLRIMNKNQESNPVTWYLNNCEKLEFYCNDNYKKYLDNLDAYFKEIFICSDEDYSLWKDIMQVEIDEIKQVIPKTYEYELSKANKIIK